MRIAFKEPQPVSGQESGAEEEEKEQPKEEVPIDDKCFSVVTNAENEGAQQNIYCIN